jgi:hypothetical protein
MIQSGGQRVLVALLFLAAAIPGEGADIEVKAGGVSLTLPGPASDFGEVGDKLRTTIFELLVPSTNRLLSAYIPAKTLAELSGGLPASGLDTYAMVEVVRRHEYSDCTPGAFDQVLKGAEPAMGKFDAEKVGQLEQEMNIHLKSIGTKPIEMGHPEMLGAIFQCIRLCNAHGYQTGRPQRDHGRRHDGDANQAEIDFRLSFLQI